MTSSDNILPDLFNSFVSFASPSHTPRISLRSGLYSGNDRPCLPARRGFDTGLTAQLLHPLHEVPSRLVPLTSSEIEDRPLNALMTF